MSDRWQNAAECRGDMNEEWLGDTLTVDTATACFVCRVRIECLTEALPRSRDADVGIWGGTTANKRGDIRRNKASVADAWLILENTVKGAHHGRHHGVDHTGGLLSRGEPRPGTRPGDRRVDG